MQDTTINQIFYILAQLDIDKSEEEFGSISGKQEWEQKIQQAAERSKNNFQSIAEKIKKSQENMEKKL